MIEVNRKDVEAVKLAMKAVILVWQTVCAVVLVMIACMVSNRINNYTLKRWRSHLS